MKFICMHCSQEMESDKAYIIHMETVHQGESQLAAIQKQKSIEQNIPKTTNLPPGIDPANLPDPTFMETIAEIAKAEAALKQQSPAPKPQEPQKASPPVSPVVKKPIILEYKYSGHCPDCGQAIRTIMLSVKVTLHAIAFCTQCDKEWQEIEVHPIEAKASSPPLEIENTITIKPFKKGGRKRGRKPNSKLNPTLQSSVQPVPETSQPSL